MRRIALLFALALVAVAALVPVVHGQEGPPGSTVPLGATPPPGTTEPPPAGEPPSLPPLLIPDGVTIGSVAVGGLTVEQARLAVDTAFAQPVEIVHKRLRWLVDPERLGARARVDAALSQALVAAPGSQVDLVVSVRGQDVREYVDTLERRVSRKPRDARLRLVKLRPRITEARPGLSLDRYPTIAAIVQTLRANERGPVQIETDPVKPKITAASFGPIVVIRRESTRLFLYRGEKHVRTFRVATGQAAYPTPVGRFSIVTKQRNPWWYPPPTSDWAEGLEPVPPGPGNPLGTRWMGLSAPLVGIHGTPDAASIGYSASHGCIRMLVSEAEWLFDRVRVGTTVFIVRA